MCLLYHFNGWCYTIMSWHIIVGWCYCHVEDVKPQMVWGWCYLLFFGGRKHFYLLQTWESLGWYQVKACLQLKLCVLFWRKPKSTTLSYIKAISNCWSCVGNNIAFSKLTSTLKHQLAFVLGGHMTHTDWYIHTCQHMNM